jgi:hypothetical protein
MIITSTIESLAARIQHSTTYYFMVNCLAVYGTQRTVISLSTETAGYYCLFEEKAKSRE